MRKPQLPVDKSSFWLILILFLSVIFRFYHFTALFPFGMDQEYELFLVKNIVTFKHIPLIGVNASDTGIYLGPLFIYFATIPFYIFAGNPLGWGIVAAVLGSITTFVVYKVGKKMFSQKVGLIAGFLYSTSFLTSFYDRQFWNPLPVPLLSLLTGYLLFQILSKKYSSLIWLALIFSLYFHTHLSLLIFIPLILYIVWVKRREFSKKIILISFLIFLITQSPQIVFELRHNFLNTRATARLLLRKTEAEQSTVIGRNRLFLSSIGRFLGMSVAPDLSLESGQCRELAKFQKDGFEQGALFVFLIGILLYWQIRNKNFKNNHYSNSFKVLIGILILTLIFTIVYPRYIFEYYYLYFFPWLAILLGIILSIFITRKYGKILVGLVLALFFISNLISLITAVSSYSYSDKLAATQFAKKYVQSRNYSLEALGECPRFGGYRYLFGYIAGPPIHSYMDSYFAWLYQDTFGDQKPEYIALLSLIDDRDNPKTIARWQKAKFSYLQSYQTVAENTFGRIGVYILKTK